MNDKDYYILDTQMKLLKDIRKFAISTLFLFNLGLHNVLATDNGSVASEAPGFEMIASLITLGIIAFLAPFLKREKTESQ